MDQFQNYTIAPEHAGLTVDEYLRNVLGFSGRALQRLTRSNGLFLNRKKVFLQKKIKAQDVLRIREEPGALTSRLLPEPGPLDILYEDADLIIVNKPPFQLVHPSGQTTRGTLANILAGVLTTRDGQPPTIRPLHRLDRNTSGCVVFAKSARSQHLLEQQLQAGTLQRIYQVLIEGRLQPSQGSINAPIGSHPFQPNRRAVSDAGDAAVTHYRTLRSNAQYAWLEARLETGRTHQIRVHLAHVGHPVIGDSMYGSRSPWLSRQALHACSITFTSLQAGSRITVQAPLPSDFALALATLLPPDEASTTEA